MSIVCTNCDYQLEQDYLFGPKELKRLKNGGQIITCPNCPPPPPAETILEEATITRDGEKLIIKITSFSLVALFLSSIMVFMTLLGVLLIPVIMLELFRMPPSLKRHIITVVCMIPILPPIYYIYSILVICKNRVIFTINREQGTFKMDNKPLPWFNRRSTV